MTTPQGMPIWYELLTPDVEGARRFYGEIVGWTATEMGSPEQPYHVWAMDGIGIGGLAAPQPGATSGWLAYFHVADLAAKVHEARDLGGQVLMDRYDIPDVGAIALLADPQGAPFYLMEPRTDADGQASTSFSETLPGRCAWNELVSTDHKAGLRFYGALLGWSSDEVMPMAAMGDYTFIDCHGTQLGAAMDRASPEQPLRWSFYFKISDVDAAAAQVKALGGHVVMGPTEVPGGQRIIVAIDPAGAGVGFVSGERQ